MEASIELIFLLVFFVPMGILVALNVLLYRDPPDVVAPWARIAAPSAPEPAPLVEARIPAACPVEADNEEEALEAA